MDYLGIQNFNGFMAKNIVIHSGTTFPTLPTFGLLFYKTDVEKAYIYVATGWRELQGINYYGP